MRRLGAAALLLACAGGVRADTLADVRATLTQLRGTTPVHVTFDIQRSRKSEGRFANQQSVGTIAVDVVDDSAGVHVTFPRALIERAERETREHEADPRKTQPTRAAIDDTQASDLSEALDFADPLLRLIAIGAKVSETRGTRDGRPVRVLVLKLSPKLPPEATSIWNVKFTEDRLTLWVGDDNVPVAAERIRRGTAGFMFIKGQMTDRSLWSFVRHTDRLLVTREETSFAGSGFGQKGEGKDVHVVTVR